MTNRSGGEGRFTLDDDEEGNGEFELHSDFGASLGNLVDDLPAELRDALRVTPPSRAVPAKSFPPPPSKNVGGWGVLRHMSASALGLFDTTQGEEEDESEEGEEEGGSTSESSEDEQKHKEVVAQPNPSGGGWLSGLLGRKEATSPPPPEVRDEAPASWLSSLSTSIGVRVVDRGQPEERLSALCSWCFATCPQHIVDSKWLARAHYRCEECGRLTTPCFGCREGVARCYGESADTMCFRCTGLYDRVEGDLARLKIRGRKCSWCRSTCVQTLHRAASTASDTGGRDMYRCDGCSSLTLKCGRCANFARGHELWRDALCVVCDGTFKDWDGALRTWVGRMGWCSWCIAQCKHELAQRALLFRSTYRCLSCQNPTLECSKCKTEMARASDGVCVACIQGKRWEDLQSEKQRAFDASNWSVSRGMEEMARDSREKKLAWAHGHMRSFLLLVSMRPALRSQCATSLGVPLLGTDLFGDSHREAWALISAPNRGLAAQTVESQRTLIATVTPTALPTWYHVLRRLLDRTQFPGERGLELAPGQVMAACRSRVDPSLVQLEKEALARIGRFCLETGRIDAVDFVREDRDGLHLVLGHYLEALGGNQDDRAVLLYAWKVVLQRRGASKVEGESSSSRPKKAFPVAPELAPLFNAVAILLNQRVLLAAEGIQLQDFFFELQQAH